MIDDSKKNSSFIIDFFLYFVKTFCHKNKGNTARMRQCDNECIFRQMQWQKSKVYWR